MRSILGVIAVGLLMVAASCGSDTTTESTLAEDELRIASFDFAESELLAELYAQAAESVGVPVARVGAAGPREVVRPALDAGTIDLVPEYLGTALKFTGADEVPADPEAAAELLGELLEPRGLKVLEPAPAEDVNVFVVHADTASAHQLAELSDLAGAGLERFGGPVECRDRPLCLVGLATTYGVSFDEFVAQPSLLFTAESLRTGEIDIGLLFSTSPELDDEKLVALRDDLRLQPPENLIPMVRREAIEAWPELERRLNDIAARLTTAELRELNRQVSSGTPVADAAASWLEANG